MPGKRIEEIRVFDFEGEMEAMILLASKPPSKQYRTVEVKLTPETYTILAGRVQEAHCGGDGRLRPFLCNHVGWVWYRPAADIEAPYRAIQQLAEPL